MGFLDSILKKAVEANPPALDLPDSAIVAIADGELIKLAAQSVTDAIASLNEVE